MKSVSVLKAKFLRSNLNSHFTRLWDEMNEHDRKYIQEIISLLSNEVVVICFFSNRSYWWSLTNMRLLIYENGEISTFIFSEIKEVQLKEIMEGNKSKIDSTNLELLTTRGNLTLHVEEGSWPTIYNILKFAVDGFQE